MERFATNKNGNIDSGTEVLANNIVFMQQAKELAISNLFGDLFFEGILNTDNEDTMFKITANSDGTFNVGQGIAYKQNVAVEPMIYERIVITDATEEYDATKPQQTTFDGVDQNIATPKSSGCKNIPISNVDTTYYVDLRYLSVCDNNNNGDGLSLTNYSIAKNQTLDSDNKVKRFYKWIDGYEIKLVTTVGQIQGICLGTVSKNSNNEITITDNERTGHLLINSRVFIEYFTSGQGIIITTEEGSTTLSVNVDNKTIEIEDNYVRVTKEGLYPFTKFSINSGPTTFLTNPQGNMVALTVAAGLDPLWINPAYDDRYSITSDDIIVALDVQTEIQTKFSGNAGIYTICINNTDKENNNDKLSVPKLEVMYEVSGESSVPTNIAYKVYLDMSQEPYKAKWFDGSNWLEYYGVPIGLVQVSIGGSIVGLKQFDFNRDYAKWHEVGTPMPYFGGILPPKYLLCDGANTYSPLLYNDLYRKIGVKFGGIDGTNFAVPDFTDRVIWGSNSLDTFNYIAAGLPNIAGVVASEIAYSTWGAFKYRTSVSNIGNSGEASQSFMNFNASDGECGMQKMTATNNPTSSSNEPSVTYQNNVYGKSETVQPAALQSPIIIRYTI